MKFNVNCARALLTVGVMGLLVATANADMLNIGGNITVSGANGGTISFNPNPAPFPGTFRINTSDGIFAALSGTTGTESTSLSSVNAPINTAINIPGFLTFTADPNLSFTLKEVLGGNTALGPCTATSVVCNPVGTPFNLVNTSPVSSSASFTVMGDFVNSATSQVFGAQGVYSASFANQTLQQILAAFTQTGSVVVPSSYAQFTAAIVPEPNTAYMLFGSGFALIGLRACFSKLRRKQV